MKYKWLYLTVELEIEQVSENLLNAKFNTANGYGFEVYHDYDDIIDASYFEHINVSNSYQLPDGSKINNSYIKITEFDFNIIKFNNNKYIIRISTPPRSIKNFINNLASSLKNKIYISSIEINIRNLIYYLAELKEITLLKVNKLAANDIKLDNFNYIDILIKSNNSPLLTLQEKFGNQSYILKLMECSLFYNGHLLSLKVTNNGVSEMDLDFHDIFIKFLTIEEQKNF